MKLSAGSRNFLRYGYGDLLREDRKYGVLHRIWPGTQRLLIWGDPVTAASLLARLLVLRQRRRRDHGAALVQGAARLGHRRWALRVRRHVAQPAVGLAEVRLQPPRVGAAAVQPGHRAGCLAARHAARVRPGGARTSETALAHSSRILPIVTTAHLPSAANNAYWPEVYLNHSLIDGEHPAPTPTRRRPSVFGTVSPLDPQLFYRIDDFADALLEGARSGKYTPIEVARWLEDHAAAATESLARAERRATATDRPEYRRLAIDVAVAADLGRFFAAKFRAGVLYRIFDRTGDRAALEEALRAYRAARAAWAGHRGPHQGRLRGGHHRRRVPPVARPLGRPAGGHRRRHRGRRGTTRHRPSPRGPTSAIARAIAEALGRPATARRGRPAHPAGADSSPGLRWPWSSRPRGTTPPCGCTTVT